MLELKFGTRVGLLSGILSCALLYVNPPLVFGKVQDPESALKCAISVDGASPTWKPGAFEIVPIDELTANARCTCRAEGSLVKGKKSSGVTCFPDTPAPCYKEREIEGKIQTKEIQDFISYCTNLCLGSPDKFKDEVTMISGQVNVCCSKDAANFKTCLENNDPDKEFQIDGMIFNKKTPPDVFNKQLKALNPKVGTKPGAGPGGGPVPQNTPVGRNP